jgi:hypothetical protein
MSQTSRPNLIQDMEGESIANIFCFGAFANKVAGIVHNDCTGKFPLMLLNRNVCFFVMYLYEMDAIIITSILSLDSECVLEAYKQNFEYLVSKGLKPKVNVMIPWSLGITNSKFSIQSWD